MYSIKKQLLTSPQALRGQRLNLVPKASEQATQKRKNLKLLKQREKEKEKNRKKEALAEKQGET
jgi:hypothetical protein